MCIRDRPNILETIALSYIGLLLLREPVTVAEVYSWIESGDLLYYSTSKEVPLAMRGRLPATYQDLLEPQKLDQPQKLHQAILDQLTVLTTDFGMSVPDINSPLVLYRWSRQLALPIEVFAATQRLARAIDVDFAFIPSANLSTTLVLRYPEARLMATLVVVTKLLFPMDGIERHPVASSDLSALTMDWHAWAEQKEREGNDGHEQRPLSFSEALAYTAVSYTHLTLPTKRIV